MDGLVRLLCQVGEYLLELAQIYQNSEGSVSFLKTRILDNHGFPKLISLLNLPNTTKSPIFTSSTKTAQYCDIKLNLKIKIQVSLRHLQFWQD